jgi:hypothetical protein
MGRIGPRDRVPAGSFLPPPPDDPLLGGQVKGTLRVLLRGRCTTPDMPVRSQDPSVSGSGETPGATGSKRIQYRPALIDGFLAQTGLTLEPQPP